MEGCPEENRQERKGRKEKKENQVGQGEIKAKPELGSDATLL